MWTKYPKVSLVFKTGTAVALIRQQLLYRLPGQRLKVCPNCMHTCCLIHLISSAPVLLLRCQGHKPGGSWLGQVTGQVMARVQAGGTLADGYFGADFTFSAKR